MQLLKQTQDPSKIQRLGCGSLVDFSEILKIISQCIFVGKSKILVISSSQ